MRWGMRAGMRRREKRRKAKEKEKAMTISEKLVNCICAGYAPTREISTGSSAAHSKKKLCSFMRRYAPVMRRYAQGMRRQENTTFL